jgi:hypothetical protein
VKTLITAVALIGAVVAIATVVVDEPAVDSTAAPVVRHIGEMAAERAAHQATSLPSGRVLITGGCAADGCTPFHRSAEVYDPSSRTFRPAAPMAVPRASHTATLLTDGRVLVAGGCTERSATATAETYDSEANRWMAVGNMTEPRCSHIAVPLVDGRVFVMGGGSAEVFDPATSTFSSLRGMRANHYLATRLPDGRVLLTGGRDLSGKILATTHVIEAASRRFERTGELTSARV